MHVMGYSMTPSCGDVALYIDKKVDTMYGEY